MLSTAVSGWLMGIVAASLRRRACPDLGAGDAVLDRQDVAREGEMGIVVVENDTGETRRDVRSELAGRRELPRGILEIEQLSAAEAFFEDLLGFQSRSRVVLRPAVHEGDVVDGVPTWRTHGPVYSSIFKSSLLRARIFSCPGGISKSV